MPVSVGPPKSALLCRVDSRVCALPLDHVRETMRPLPWEPLSGAPGFVRGVSIIRGEVVPVVDAALLLGAEHASPSRLITIAVGERHVALAVDAVLGVKRIPDDMLRDVPPLLEGASGEVVAAIGALDAELLVVLDAVRLVPASVWVLVDGETSSS